MSNPISGGHHAGAARRLAAAPGRRDGRRCGARTRLGPTDFRADLRRPREAGRGAGRRRPGPPRHLHLRPRVARADRPGPARVVHRPQPHLPAALRPRPTQRSPRHRSGSRCAPLRAHGRRRCDQPGLRALRHGARADRGDLGQPPAVSTRSTTWSPCATTTERVVGTVTGVDHERLFGDPEGGSSLWTLAVDPAAGLPGVGAALTRALADDLPRPRPRLPGSVGGPRQRGRDRALREAGLRPGPGAGRQAQERDQRAAVHPGAGDRRRPQPVRADHRRRGACAAVSGSRCSTPRPARCGCRTAAAASSPGSRCRSSPPRWR